MVWDSSSAIGDAGALAVEPTSKPLLVSWQGRVWPWNAAIDAARLVYGGTDSVILGFRQNQGSSSRDDVHEGGEILPAVQSRFF
jgi:hypothetical protein